MKIKILSTGILLLGLVFLCCCNKSPQEKRDDYLDSAAQYLEEGKYGEAAIQLQNALQIAPDDADTLVRLGETQIKLNRLNEAYRSFIRANAVDPDKMEAREHIASFLLIAKQYEKAIEKANEILNDEPGNIKAREIVYQGLFYAGENDKALEVAQNLMKDGLLSEGLFINTSQIYRSKGDTDKALELLMQGIAKYPASPTIRFLASDISMIRGDMKSAKDFAEDAYKVSDKNISVGLSLARFYAAHDMQEPLESILKDLTDSYPDNPSLILFHSRLYRQKGDQEKALVYAKKAYEIEDNPDTSMNLALILAEQGRQDEARDILQKAISEEKSLSVEPRLFYAQLLIDKGDPSGAIDILDPLIKEQSYKRPDIALTAARAYFIHGDTGNAANILDAALEADPQNTELHAMMAKVCFEFKDHDCVLKELDEVSKQSQNLAPDLLYIGAMSSLRLNLLDKAARYVESMKKLGPNAYPTLYAEVLLLSAEKKKKEAFAVAQKGLDLWPGSKGMINEYSLLGQEVTGIEKTIKGIESYCNLNEDSYCHIVLAGLCEKGGRVDDAVSHIEKSIELDPANQNLYFSLASIYARNDRIEDAIIEYKAIFDKDPDNLTSATMLALLYHSKGYKQKELELYRDILEKEPSHMVAANNLGWSLSETGNAADLDKALVIVSKAKDKHPENPQLADTLGVIYLKKGLYENAIGQFTLALEGLPDDPQIHFHMAEALIAQDRETEAARHLKAALDSDEGFSMKDEAQKILNTLDAGIKD